VSRSIRATSVRLRWGVGSSVRRAVVLAAGLLVVAAIRPEPVAAAAAGLVLLVILVCLAESTPREVDVAIGLSAGRLSPGEVVRIDIAVSSAAGSPGVGAVATVALTGEVEPAGRQRWRVRSGGEPLAITVRPREWMRDSLGHLQLRLATPLGGWVAVATVELPSLTVHPPDEPHPQVYAPPDLLSRFGAHPGRLRGAGMEFAELRPYVTGDALRDVDWKSSARTRQLMVSQRYQDQSADVVVLVDHTSVAGGYDRRLHDRVVRGSAAVARAYLDAGDRVGLVMYGSPVRWLAPGQGRSQELRILDDIVLRPIVQSIVSPDLARIPGVALPPRSIVFCFSALLDDRMVGAIARLARHGHRLVIVDTIGVEPATWPSGGDERVRVEWPRHRRTLRARLSELGAIVIDDVHAIGPAVRGMSRAGVGR
jgi:uncharacterized protein (DUF58 family)